MASSRYMYIPPGGKTGGGDCGCSGSRKPAPVGTGPHGIGMSGGSPHTGHHVRPPFFPGPPRIPGPGPAPFPAPVFPGTPPAYVFVETALGHSAPVPPQSFRIRYRPGISIHDALILTNAVRFAPGGRILSVSGIPVTGGISGILRLNGRQIPTTLLAFPLQPNDTVQLELTALARQ